MTSPRPAKKAPAKKAPARRSPRAARPQTQPAPEPVVRPGDIQPVVIGKAQRGHAEVEMVTLFELDDVPYRIPRNPSAALVLSWMLDSQQRDIAKANVRMATQLLGDGPLKALASSPDVQPEHLEQIFINIGTVFFNSENFSKIVSAADPS